MSGLLRGAGALLVGGVLLMAAAGQGAGKKPAAGGPLVIAHRGFSYVAPENTMAAFRRGWEAGADGIELDVHLTADGRVAVIHDEHTSRTARGQMVVIANATAAEVAKVDVGSFKAAKFAGEKIPFLEDVLAELPKGVRVFVEIKSGEETVEPVARIVEKSGKRDQVTIIGFKLETMAAARKAMPDRPVQWLRGQDKDPVTSKPLPLSPTLITKAKANGLTGLDLAYPGVTPEFVKAAKAEGLEVHAWTVDNPKEAKRLLQAGVDSITTNRPDEIMKAIR